MLTSHAKAPELDPTLGVQEIPWDENDNSSGSELWSHHDEAKSPGQGREVTQMIVSLN